MNYTIFKAKAFEILIYIAIFSGLDFCVAEWICTPLPKKKIWAHHSFVITYLTVNTN